MYSLKNFLTSIPFIGLDTLGTIWAVRIFAVGLFFSALMFFLDFPILAKCFFTLSFLLTGLALIFIDDVSESVEDKEATRRR